ncbi:winged helix-turn-helix transcriptional regulator [Hwanghaeella sp. LZ110]|uniref:winged helix-turn-helix transcriptional regulator n=1 Tax=Hwanghaeella sp. LZ110 TaxID=3402810 RepID=UPI003B676D17
MFPLIEYGGTLADSAVISILICIYVFTQNSRGNASVSAPYAVGTVPPSITYSVPVMEADGIVRRIVHHQVPPKVEYCLTDWGQSLCPALDALLKWAEQRYG